MAIGTEEDDDLNKQLVQYQAKLKQEEMIHDSILRIQQQYTDSEGVKKAQDKLEEAQKRIKYLKLEIEKLTGKLSIASPKEEGASMGEIIGSLPMVQTPFDYWKPSGCLTSDALEFKLAELLYKLHIEEKIQNGSLKYIKAISELPISGDKIRETIRVANQSLEQCDAKIHLLSSAIRSYQTLMIDRASALNRTIQDTADSTDEVESGKLEVFNGRLTVKIYEVSKCILDDGNSLMVTCATDGHEVFTQKLKRKDKCDLNQAGVEIELNSAAPVTYFELLLRTKELHPVGLLFFKLSWLGEGDEPFQVSEILGLEPDGLVHLSLSYTPNETRDADEVPAPQDNFAHLARQNAIQRKRFEKLGHNFYSRKFYQLVKCAVCHEFVYQAAAYQCDLCKYMCHKRCADMILTKCVSATTKDLRGYNPLADINYSLDHGFVEMQSLLPAWCMHCGKFGRKDFLKCKECDNTCHQKCAHNIPSHCGMPTSLPELAALRLSGSKATSPTGDALRSFTDNSDHISNYEIIRLLGKGNFGKVVLARHLKSGKLFAIKILKKDAAADNDELENIEIEREILELARSESHPFLVQMQSFFTDALNFYFVMEYIIGGDLMFHIQKRRFTEAEARFYAAEVLLALEYLHANQVIYRDLKLDNIMLTVEGHVKLTDFGLCKPRMGWNAQTDTFCGTPEFIAPEILTDKTYTKAVDWWAFGVLLYELVMGQSPFSGKTEAEIFKSIMAGRYYFSPKVSQEAKDLILRLLTRNPKIRLGAGPTDSAPIKKHPFFKDIDFDRLLMKLDPTPFLPKTDSPAEALNFDKQFTSEAPNISIGSSMTLR